MRRRLSLLLAGFVLPVLLASPAHAERDFEFLQKLMDQGYLELVELYLDKLESRDANLALLGQALVVKHRMDRERTPEKQEELYAESLRLLNDFVRRAGERHPQYGRAIDLIADLKVSRAKSIIQRIKNKMVTDPDKIRQLRQEAADIYDGILSPMRELAVKRVAKVKELYPDPPQGAEDLQGRERQALDREFQGAVEAVQKYLEKAFQKEDVYERFSPAHRDYIENDILPFVTETQATMQTMVPMTEGVVLLLQFYLGKSYGALKDKEKAHREGFDQVLAINVKHPFVDAMRMHTYHEMVKMYQAMDEYERAIKYGNDQLMEFRAMLAKPDKGVVVQDTQLRKAEALAETGNFEKAVDTCKMVVKYADGWMKSRGEQLMADLIRKSGRTSKDPKILFASAEGAMRKGYDALRRKKVDEAPGHFEHAVSLYHYAALVARDDEVDLPVRLEVEPRSWFQAGIGYYKLKLPYEAMFCFEAVLSNYGPVPELVLRDDDGTKLKEYLDARGLEGEQRKRFEDFIATIKRQRALTEEVESIEGLVKKSANNLRIVASARKRATKHPFDIALYRDALNTLYTYDPEKAADKDFFIAQAMHEEADGTALSAREAAKQGRKEVAERLRDEAEKAYLASAERYLQTPATSKYYEKAHFTAGHMYYKALNLNRRGDSDEDSKQKVQEYGRKTLEMWARYREIAESNPTVEKARLLQRARYIRDSLYAAATVRSFMDDWDGVIDAVERFHAWVNDARNEWKEYAARDKDWKDYYQEDQKQAHGRDLHLGWLRFKSVRAQALKAAEAADSLAELKPAEELLQKARQISLQWKDDPKAREIYYRHAVNFVGATYTQFSNRIRDWMTLILKQKEEAQGDEERLAELDKKFKEYEAKVEDYSGRGAQVLIDLIELDPERAKDIDFMLGIADQLFGLKDWKNCQKIYQRVLDTFDPDNNIKYNFDMGGRQLFASEAAKINVYPYEMQKKLKDLVSNKLADYIFDDIKDHSQVAASEIKEELADYDKALATIEQIFTVVDNLPRHNRKEQTLECAPFLKKVQDELEMRLKILGANDRISVCYMRLAEDAQAAGGPRQQEALELWRKAAESFQNLSEYWWSDPDIQAKLARCYQQQGMILGEMNRKDEALDMLSKARKTYLQTQVWAERGDELWWQTQLPVFRIETRMVELGGSIDIRKDDEMISKGGMDLAVHTGAQIKRLLLTQEKKLAKRWPDYRDYCGRLDPHLPEDWDWDFPEVEMAEMKALPPTKPEKELLIDLLNVDMTILTELDLPVPGIGKVEQAADEAVASRPEMQAKRRKLWASRLRAIIPTTSFASNLTWDKLHQDVKKKIDEAGLEEAEVRGLLAQGRLIFRSLQADSKLLTKHRISHQAARVRQVAAEAVERGKVKADERYQIHRERIRETLSSPDFQIYEFEDLRKEVRNYLTRMQVPSHEAERYEQQIGASGRELRKKVTAMQNEFLLAQAKLIHEVMQKPEAERQAFLQTKLKETRDAIGQPWEWSDRLRDLAEELGISEESWAQPVEEEVAE